MLENSISNNCPDSKRFTTRGFLYPQQGGLRVSYLKQLDIPLVGIGGSALIIQALRFSSRDKDNYVWEAFIEFLYAKGCTLIDVICVVKFFNILFRLGNVRSKYNCVI